MRAATWSAAPWGAGPSRGSVTHPTERNTECHTPGGRNELARHPTLRARFPCNRQNATKARKVFLTYLERIGVGDSDSFELEHAVGEALANAVEHGYRDNSYLEIRCRFDGKQLLAEIEDDGPGFDKEKMRGGPGLRGFGFTLMRSLVDRISVMKRGRLVRLEKHVASGAPAAPESV